MRELLPGWAIEVDALDYGDEFDREGLYYTVHDDGTLAAVGVVETGSAASWTANAGEPTIMCSSIITLRADLKSGHSRGRTWGTTYEEGGTLRTANGYTEDDDIAEAKASFEEWAADDIRGKVAYIEKMRGSAR